MGTKSFRNLFSISMILSVLIVMVVTFVKVETVHAQNGRIKLKVADSLSVTHTFSKDGIQYWMKRVRELTNNRVEFQHFPGEQLSKALDMFDAVRNGVTDIGYIIPLACPDRMPLLSGSALPGIWENCKVGNVGMWAVENSEPVLTNDFLKNDVRPIMMFTNQVFQLFTVKKPVKEIADIHGLKIRSSGGYMDLVLKSFGAVPVPIPAPEIYEALQRGTIDGFLVSAISAHPYRVEEVCKYGTWGINASGGTLGYVINEKVWQKLPADIRQAMLRATDETLVHLGTVMDDEDIYWKAEFIKKGVAIYDLTPEQQKEWAAAQKPVVDEWLHDMANKKLPGQQVLDLMFAKTAEVRKALKK